MPVTTQAAALVALRAQRDALTAENPQDRAKIRAVARVIREIRGGADGDDVFDAFAEVRDMERTPALFDESEFRDAVVTLAQNWPAMPDEPDAGNARIVDKQRTRAIWLRCLRNSDAAFDPIRGWLSGMLERIADTYADERPIESQFGPAITALESGALDASALSAALSTITQNRDRLRPPVQA